MAAAFVNGGAVGGVVRRVSAASSIGVCAFTPATTAAVLRAPPLLRTVGGGGAGAPLPATTAPTRHAGVSMSAMTIAHNAVLVYAVLMAGGGVSAFLRTKSAASLISGVGSGAALYYAYTSLSIPTALVVSLVLVGVFALRYSKTRKMMPAGALGIASGVFALIFASALL